MDIETFETVLAKCLEGSASEPEQQALVDAAQASEALDLKLRQAVALDASLHTLRIDAPAILRSVHDRLENSGTADAVRPTLRRSSARRTRTPERGRWPIVFQLAALLALGVGLGWFAFPLQRGSAAGEQRASVIAVQGEVTAQVGGRTAPLVKGMTLSRGDGFRSAADGRAVLGYPDGTTVAARSRSEVTVVDAPTGKRLSLTSGSLVAEVAKQDHAAPMTVLMPLAEATVVGTRFGLSHNRKGSLLEVMEGVVRYRRLADGATLDVTAGQSVLAAPDLPFVARPQRVDRGITMMYLFDEMSGTVVHDVSGIAPAMDLTIARPEDAVWTPDGLNDGGGRAGISYRGIARKFIDGIRTSHGMTIEFWVTTRGTTSAERVTTVKLSNGSFVWNSLIDPEKRSEGLQHVALVFAEENGRYLLTTYDYRLGESVHTTTDLGDFTAYQSLLTHDDDLHIEITPDPPPPGATWTSEYHLVALFGRPLTAAEVHRNEQAGIPTAAPLDLDGE